MYTIQLESDSDGEADVEGGGRPVCSSCSMREWSRISIIIPK